MTNTDFPNQNLPVSAREASIAAFQSERMHLVREASPTNNLRDYLSIFFKHKITILVLFLVFSVIGTALAVIYSTWIYEPKFLAKSSVLVKLGWENYSPDLTLEKRHNPTVSMNDILNSEMLILGSRELKTKIISSLKPETIFPRLAKAPYQGLTNSEAALVLMDQFLVIRGGKGSVIDVAFEGNNPGTAAALVNQLVNLYIDKRTEIYKDPKSVLFLEKKTEEYRQKLAESEARLKAFREQTKIIAFDEQRGIFLRRRGDLTAALNGTANGMKEIQEKVGELEKQLSSLPKTTMTATSFDISKDTDAKLLNLQIQEKELLSRYKEDNLLVSNIRTQIQMVKEYREKESANKAKPGGAPPDPVYQDIQKQIFNGKAELSALKVRHADTEKELGELSTEIQAFEANEGKNKELTREVAANEEKFRDYRQKLEESRVYDELDRQKMTSVSVIEPAAVPISPVKRQTPLILLIAAAIGAAAAGSIGIAYALEFGKQVLSTPMEAEKRLDLPVLVAIPIKS